MEHESTSTPISDTYEVDQRRRSESAYPSDRPRQSLQRARSPSLLTPLPPHASTYEKQQRPQNVETECIIGSSRKPTLLNPLGLPHPLTNKQLFYIFATQGIGAAFIDGAANFGIACAMYRSQDDITMWQLSHNTIAGDCAVTTFIQGILSFVIASSMVHVDMRKGSIDAFPFPWPDTSFASVPIPNPSSATTKHGYIWRQFHQTHGLGKGLHFFSGSDANDLLDFSLTRKVFFKRLILSIWKGSILSALYFLILWPLTIAIIAPVWGGKNMAHSWTPQIIKLVYAFILGLFQNPLIACIALGSEDSVRAHRTEVKDERNRRKFEALENGQLGANRGQLAGAGITEFERSHHLPQQMKRVEGN